MKILTNPKTNIFLMVSLLVSFIFGSNMALEADKQLTHLKKQSECIKSLEETVVLQHKLILTLAKPSVLDEKYNLSAHEGKQVDEPPNQTYKKGHFGPERVMVGVSISPESFEDPKPKLCCDIVEDLPICSESEDPSLTKEDPLPH